jgi:tRNA nucleotidyltransferase (CCA-adding enzyme)
MNNLTDRMTPITDTDLTRALAKRISEFGGTAYLVGGAVRDELMGYAPKDNDVEVFGIEEDRLLPILRGFAVDRNFFNASTTGGTTVSIVGKSFKVFKLRDETGEEVDVSIPRRDVKVAPGHRGFEVTADPFMSITQAASRRDFTINAIYKDILTGQLFDPFVGIVAIENKMITMVDSNAFSEDPLRVLRAIQFAARFGFTIEFFTWKEMKKVDLTELPAERLFTELEKLLLQSENPGSALFTLKALNSPMFSILQDLSQTPQDLKWHPEGDVLTHTTMALNEAAKLLRKTVDVGGNFHAPQGDVMTRAEKLTVMLAVLAHDFGKATTTIVNNAMAEGRTTAHDHAKAGIAPATAFLDRLGVYTIDGFDVRSQVLALVEHHLSPPQLFEAKRKDPSVNVPRALRRLALKVRLDLLAMVSLADMLGRGRGAAEEENSQGIIRWFLSFAEAAEVADSAPKPILMGRHLLDQMTAGPDMGFVLKKVFEAQLDGRVTNLQEAKDLSMEILGRLKL